MCSTLVRGKKSGFLTPGNSVPHQAQPSSSNRNALQAPPGFTLTFLLCLEQNILPDGITASTRKADVTMLRKLESTSPSRNTKTSAGELLFLLSAECRTRKRRYRTAAGHQDEPLSSQTWLCLWVMATAAHQAGRAVPDLTAARSSTDTSTPLAFQFSLFCLPNCLPRLSSWMWIKQTTWTFSQMGLLAVPLTNTMLSKCEPETQRKGNNCKGQEGNRSFAKGQHENTFLLWARALKSSQASPSLQATIFIPPSLQSHNL